jgi:CHAT domain-containing protein
MPVALSPDPGYLLAPLPGTPVLIRRILTVAAVIVVGACAASSGERTDPSADGLPSHVDAVAALFASDRPFALRLTGSRGWSACQVGDQAIGHHCRTSGRSVSRTAATDAPGTRPEDARDRDWAEALALLATDSTTRHGAVALELLERALARDGRSAALRSDLATAYAARFAATGDPFMLLSALDQIERAHELAPHSEVIVFNHALLLDELQLYAQAREEWLRYLALRPSDGWAREAQERIARIDRARAAPKPLDGNDTASIRADPYGARELAMDSLLPRIGRVSPYDTGSPDVSLHTLQRIGETLASAGDSSMLHVAASCAGASPQVRASLAPMVIGMRRFRRGENEAAYPDLQAASLAFRRAGAHPLADWADITISVIDVYSGRHDVAEQRLRVVERHARRRGDRALRGRALWITALSRARRGESARAAESYAAALDIFKLTGERVNEVAMLAQLSDVLLLAGRDRDALQGYTRALALQRTMQASRGRAGLLLNLGRQSEELNMPMAGIAFLREAVANAPGTGREVDPVESTVRLAQAFLGAGRADSGRARLVEARRTLKLVTDSLTRARMEMEIASADATLLGENSADMAIDRMDAVVAYYRKQGIRFGLVSHLTRRARLRIAARDTVGAEADLSEAVSILEMLSDRPGDPVASRKLAATRRDVFGELVGIRAARHDTLGAFVASERGRGNGVVRPPVTRDGETILAFAVQPAELLAWVVRGERLRMVRQRIAGDSIEHAVTALEGALRHADTLVSDSIARRLDAVLIAPVASDVADARELTIVPDAALGRLPFALLIDARGKRLIERATLAFAPAVRPVVALRPPRGDVAVVENPQFDPALFPALLPLTATAREVSAIRAAHPRARVVAGAAATKRTVLSILRGTSVVHFSGHSQIVERVPLRSHLVLARVNGAFEDNVLSAEEAAGEDFHRLDLLILASCGTTQRSSLRDGAQSGLAQAFLDAGAGAVISSLWDADDDRTASLMAALHRRLANGELPLSALRGAQLEMLKAPGGADGARTWSLFRLDRS